MGTKIDPYAPCPCGSGKKYKFCCYLKKDEVDGVNGISSSFFDKATDISDFNDFSEGYRLLQQGLQLMNASEFSAAMPYFKKALSVNPLIYSSANNLALCLFVTGQLNEAIEVQSECLETNPLQNPFGLCNMAAFYHIKGDEFRAWRYLKDAIRAEIPSNDACIKICETIARFKRHQEILDFVSTSEYEDDPGVCFYTGVAAANLGDRERAACDFKSVSLGFYKASMAQRYMKSLREDSDPNTVKGDWPYLYSYEISPVTVIRSMVSSGDKSWKELQVIVDFAEALLNETVEDPKAALGLLLESNHPAATELLWTILKGSYGPDSIRIEALNILRMKDEVGRDEKVEVLMDGKKEKICLQSSFLNPEFRFAEALPSKQDKVYIKIIKEMEKWAPDWGMVDKQLKALIKEFPDFYPASYNYAIALLRRGRADEAGPIVHRLVEKYPEYLFARSTLLQLYLGAEQIESIEELIETTPEITETHPDAMATWMAAKALYYDFVGDEDQAANLFESAQEISPDLFIVQQLVEKYQR